SYDKCQHLLVDVDPRHTYGFHAFHSFGAGRQNARSISQALSRATVVSAARISSAHLLVHPARSQSNRLSDSTTPMSPRPRSPHTALHLTTVAGPFSSPSV